MVLTKLLNVTHPLILKVAIDAITCVADDSVDGTCPPHQEVYFLVALYGLTKFAAEIINYLREIPFSQVSGSAEVFIASTVYEHTQK